MSVAADTIRPHTGPVTTEPDLALIGRALGDPSRAAMLSALMTGTAWTVGELASHAAIARSTASEHVQTLAAAGLAEASRQGRHTYVTLAGPDIADALEALSLVAPPRPVPASLRGQRYARELAAGRTCYRHLAGALGVGLADRLVARGLIRADFRPTASGLAWFAARGVAVCEAERDRPTTPLLRPCRDWTERRLHLAGPLATRLTARAFDQGWVERGSHPRSVRLTAEGRARLWGG